LHTRLSVLGVGFVLALSGCSSDGSAGPKDLPPAPVVQPPAASAGGACILWDYNGIEQQLGVRFDVAAAGQVDDTSTCVVQSQGATRPDLVLSVVEQTPADAALYTAELMPAKATKVKKLGKAAYRLVSPASGDDGPVIEVGWLTADRQLMTLRFTFGTDATTADATEMAPKLVDLAHALADSDA
jgi:hypothetical protein